VLSPPLVPPSVVPDAFHVYDTTLRDGTQMEGLSLSVNDKLAVARHLDDLGVGFIEGGWPGANPKDAEFFRRARTELSLRTAQLAAFGATRRAGAVAADDPQVAHLRESGAGVVTLVAKSDVRHVERALRTTRAENLAMVRDTVAHLRAEGVRVFLDAEHFFDGYRVDPAYAVEVLQVAAEAGADVLVLCDTNGGMLPSRLADVVHEVVATGLRVGIHAHDDTACAVANSLAAVDAGATHVQGTANGYGERSGNANLFSVVAALETKLDRRVLPPGRLVELGRVAHAVSEVANIAPDPHQPWVGASAFAHKAGLHVSAIKADPDLYQHVDPAVVGNDMRLLVSELAGRATVELKGRAIGLAPDRDAVGRVLERIKDLESVGYSFEAAEASFELLLREEMGERPHYFDLESWRVIVESRGGAVVSEATVKLHAKGERIVATGEGNGPVNALDNALRLALCELYPPLAALELVDYKVRIVSGAHGTGAVTRVLVETSDGTTEWDTVGVHENVIAASWQALEEAYTTGLLRQGSAPT
jgi:2-isopropylmalate synthase